MTIKIPKNEQELLDAYGHAMVSLVSEFGGGTDFKQVKQVTDKYALEHGLVPPDIDWSIYIFEG